MSERANDVATNYVSEHFGALLSGTAEVPAYFALNTVASLQVFGQEPITFQKPEQYVSSVVASIGHASVHVSQVQSHVGVAGSILVVVSGVFTDEASTREFTLTSVLSESDADNAFYTTQEALAIAQPVAVAAQAEAAPAPEQNAAPSQEATPEPEEVLEESGEKTPPSPPSSPAAAPVAKPAEEVAAAEVTAPAAATEVKPEPKPAAAAKKADSPAAAPAPAPKAKGWAAIAAAAQGQTIAPIVKPPPKPATPNPEPVAQKPAAKAPAPRPKETKKKPESTAVIRCAVPVSNEEVLKALPAELKDAVVELRNKTDEDVKRMWIEFAVPGAVGIINNAKMTLAGHTVVAELPRKKN